MKKITLLILFIGLFSSSYSQNYFHRLYRLGEASSTAKATLCNQTYYSTFKVNISGKQLMKGDVCYISGDYSGYYLVERSESKSDQDADENINGGNVSLVSLSCQIGKYHVLKYRGRSKDVAVKSKCSNKAESSVGVNIDISQKLTTGKIYNIDRGSGIGYRYYEVTSAQDTPQTSAPTTIGANNVGTSFYADCSGVELAALEITNLKIKKNGSSEIFNSNTNSTPILSYGNSYEFIYTVKNNGGGRASNINLSKFFSYNSSLDRYNDYFIADDEISSISPGDEATLRTYVNPNYGYIGNASVSNSQGYYFIFSIVYKNEDNSQSEYENRIGFIYSTNTASKSISAPYKLQGFDFSGNEVLSKEVMSKEEEEEVIQSLPKGNYIIKANDETYKIKKD